MNILFTIAAPKQLYVFNTIGKELIKKGHDVCYLIRDYGPNLAIADYLKLNYSSFGSKNYLGLAGKFKEMILNDLEGIKKISKLNPDLVVGDVFLGHPAFFLNKPSLAVVDGDAKGIPYLIYNYLYLSKAFIIPSHLDFKTKKLKIAYPGFLEMVYLDKRHYNPISSTLVSEILEPPYSIIRVSQFGMSHDFNIQGLSEKNLGDLISYLEKYSTVYISSEKKLSSHLERYRLKIPPYYIHDAIYGSSLFISETAMAVESALLGVPTIQLSPIRRNNGYPSYDDYSNFRFFRNRGLYRYYKVSHINGIKDGIQKIMSNPFSEKELLKNRINELYAESIDVSAFLSWFISNFPNSLNVYTENTDQLLNDFRYNDGQ